MKYNEIIAVMKIEDQFDLELSIKLSKCMPLKNNIIECKNKVITTL